MILKSVNIFKLYLTGNIDPPFFFAQMEPSLDLIIFEEMITIFVEIFP